MQRRRIISTAIAALLALASGSLAERAPEDRSQATHVVVGTVDGVYVRDRGEFHDYVVEIAVEKVEKGDALKPGQTLYAHCYLWNTDHYKGKKLSEKEQKQIALRWSSYDGVPKEKERVRVHVRYRAGRYEGIYPDWYEIAKGK